MPRGRPRKILAMNNRHFTNAEIAERQATESFFKSGRDQLTPCDCLSPRAKSMFISIVNAAFWLDNLDLPDIALYCFYWDKALTIVESADRYIEAEEINADKPNLIRRALREYHSEMRSISAKLGLSAIDRLKLAAPKVEKPKNKFDEFM